MKPGFIIRRMLEQEIAEIAIEWAAKEGWNPGLDDAACFYAADQQGFLIGELDGQPVAVISAVVYDNRFSFMGFYIVKPEFRGRGYGMQVWRAALDYLGSRNIGGDGVLERIKDYETQGFRAYYKNRRYQGLGSGRAGSAGLIEIQKVDFEKLVSYDDAVFPAKRHQFLKCWIGRPQTKGYALLNGEKLSGYGVIRPCYKGYKIGPLFADNAETAEKIFNALRGEILLNQEFFLDIPETNPEAINLAEKYGMKVVFETARIYSKFLPATPLEKVYGVTSFELG
ncbi:MAG: GNAT family N-acetyltransferase [Candidatus Omnitrophica bacterium]|jgi:ribosomal protein S18 acetylase RimI-like enzyme|nr:GNAT family N-acetyltransferase [Candidatus Omnitrophota bacterium]